jgi:hypothetical protein
MISQAKEMAMVRDTERHGVVHIIFENFEDISPELQDRIRGTVLAALANIPGVRLRGVDGLPAEATSNNSH